jgi:DNA-binding beta-propeller fold protein YncE
MRSLAHTAALLWVLLSMGSARGQERGETLRLEKAIPLPGVAGRIDHFAADTAGQRVFIAALGNGSIEVLDLRRGERTAEIKGLQEPQGVYYDAKIDRLYVATGGDGKFHVYDGNSFAVQETLDFGSDADNVRQDPQTGELWVGYGNGGLGIVNPTGQKSGSLDLGTHPESFQFEANGDRVYVNVPKRFGVAVVDRKKRALITWWGFGGPLANYPLALDETNKRLFVGCRSPARIVVLDTGSGRVVVTFPTVGEDGFYYDQPTVNGRQVPLRTRSLVGLMPLIAVEVIETAQIDNMPGFKKRMDWFLRYREDLKPLIIYSEPCAHFRHRMLALPTQERLRRALCYMLDENEFLSPYGLRSVSRIHCEKPYVFQAGCEEHRVEYVPSEGTSYLFGGNSNCAARSGSRSIT